MYLSVSGEFVNSTHPWSLRWSAFGALHLILIQVFPWAHFKKHACRKYIHLNIVCFIPQHLFCVRKPLSRSAWVIHVERNIHIYLCLLAATYECWVLPVLALLSFSWQNSDELYSFTVEQKRCLHNWKSWLLRV